MTCSVRPMSARTPRPPVRGSARRPDRRLQRQVPFIACLLSRATMRGAGTAQPLQSDDSYDSDDSEVASDFDDDYEIQKGKVLFSSLAMGAMQSEMGRWAHAAQPQRQLRPEQHRHPPHRSARRRSRRHVRRLLRVQGPSRRLPFVASCHNLEHRVHACRFRGEMPSSRAGLQHRVLHRPPQGLRDHPRVRRAARLQRPGPADRRLRRLLCHKRIERRLRRPRAHDAGGDGPARPRHVRWKPRRHGRDRARGRRLHAGGAARL